MLSNVLHKTCFHASRIQFVNICKKQASTSQAISASRILSLDRLTVIPGARKTRKRVGRGVGSGLGKTSSHGHQFSRSTPRQFEGGQTAYWKRLPKSGFNNPNALDFEYLNIGKIQQFIDQGRLVVPEPVDGLQQQISIRDLKQCGLISQVKDGVKLLANDKELLKTAVHLEVSMASSEAIKAIEAVNGTVTCVHFNKLALRALMKPYKFDILPLRARPNPKLINYYLDNTRSGYMSPDIQLRNMKLFGSITTEDRYRLEHMCFMHAKRQEHRSAQEDLEAMQ